MTLGDIAVRAIVRILDTNFENYTYLEGAVAKEVRLQLLTRKNLVGKSGVDLAKHAVVRRLSGSVKRKLSESVKPSTPHTRPANL